jgi:DNA-binding MurR/RpiR family transcriptional regulator
MNTHSRNSLLSETMKTGSPNAIHELLKGSRRNLSEKQAILVNFLYQNYQKVAFMNIRELARETKVSEATIVRLANLLGFDGYPRLQKAVQRIVTQELTTVERMALSLSTHEFDHPIQKMLKLDLQNLVRVYQQLSAQEVDRLVQKILQAENLVVAGFMSSSPLALYFGYALSRFLRNVSTFIDDGVAVKHAVSELSAKDLFICFAFPRYPAALVQLARSVAFRKIPVMAFTDTGVSPLVPSADLCVFVHFELLGFVDSLGAPISFLAGLVAELSRREPKRTARSLSKFERFARDHNLFHRETG